MPTKIQPSRPPWMFAPTTWPSGPFDTDDPYELALVEAVADVARQVRDRREHEQLSRAALARRAGVSAHVVGDVEAGRTWPAFVTLAGLGHVMRADWKLEPRDHLGPSHPRR